MSATLLREVGLFVPKEEAISYCNVINKKYTVIKSERNVIMMCFHEGPLVVYYALVM